MDCTVTVMVRAPREDVWRRWADVPAWPGWNPECTEATATPGMGEGAALRLKLRHPGGREFFTAPRVTALEAPGRMVWLTKALGVRAETVSELVDEDGGTRVTVTSASHGPLGFAYRLVMRPRTQALIHTRMLNALSASVRAL